MNLSGRLLFALMLFLHINSALSISHRKIDYIVEIYNTCKSRITDLNIQYDGQGIFPGGEGRDLAYYSSASYDMPMTIPDVARVTWKDAKGGKYEENVPLRSLVRLRDYFGREFRINFHVCNDELHVIFGKRSRGEIRYKLKEIWTNKID